MEVTRYLFQPTSSSPVQVGTPDPTVKQEAKAKEQTEQLAKETNTTLKKAEEFINTQTRPIEPKVDTVAITEKTVAQELKVAETQEIEKTQEIAETVEVTEVSTANTQDTDKPQRKSIWDRNSASFNSIRDNIWSRRSSQSNNIWAGSSTGNFSNIWQKSNDDFKLQDDNKISNEVTNRFDFSRFSKILDFFA